MKSGQYRELDRVFLYAASCNFSITSAGENRTRHNENVKYGSSKTAASKKQTKTAIMHRTFFRDQVN